MKKKMETKTKVIICTASIAAVVGISGVIAYLTDKDVATNNFSVGQVKIELQEPSWNTTDADSNGVPDVVENIVPMQVIPKDPQVQNVGKNDAYVYLKVTVPAKSVITAAADGTVLNSGAPQDTQLFSYTVDTANWTEITTKKTTNRNASDELESYTYVYYYNTALAPTATTAKLFESVKFANVIEDQISDTESNQQIEIEAYAIQKDNLPANTTIEGAYDIYVNQNS